MKVSIVQAVGVSCLLALMVSCATPALWKATNPNECVRIPQAIANTNDLAAKGIQYRVSGATGDIYIPKSQAHKLRDYTVRLFATPVTVAIDAVGGVVVVCGMLVGGAAQGYSEEVKANPDKPILVYPADPIPQR